MNKIVFLFLFLCSTTVSFSQNILKGIVSDENGNPIPGAKVYIKNTTYGLITDYNGAYFLELKEQKEYLVHFSMLGRQDTLITVNIRKKNTELNVVLPELSTELEAVEIVKKKYNVANTIIKKVQKNKKKLANQFDNYSCDTYLKTGLEREDRWESKKDTVEEKPVKMSFIESMSHSTFITPNIYHEKIIAHHDYSDKQATSNASAVDYYLDDIITPIQQIETDPYIFFEKIQDGDFNLYQNMINLPKITEHPITSPIGVQAFTNYKFKLIGIFTENDQKIYEIAVTPRFKNAPLLRGTIYIIDEIWVIKSFNFSVNSTAMPFFKEFTVIHDYELVDGFWVPIRREYFYEINEEAFTISANTRVSHSNYVFNQPIIEKDLKNELASYTDDAFMKDSVYWNSNRPLRLKEEELLFIAEQNRIDSIKTSEHYLDSLDADFNKVTLGDVFLNGVGFRNRFKKQEIYFKSFLESFELFGVGGVRYNFTGSYSKKFENNHKIKISPSINYGFNTVDIKPKLAVDYTFLPLKFGSVEFEIGDTYEQLTNQLTAVNYVLGGNNAVRNRFVSVAHKRELINGLYGKIKLSYSDKQSVSGIPPGRIMQYIIDYVENDTNFQDVQIIGDPIQFERYTMTLVEFKLHYRFKQKYIIKNNEKLIVGTAFPELEFTFKQGIPKIFGSEVSFNLVELKISDEINLGNYGDSNWKVIGGSFLNKKDLRIIEHKFFKASDLNFFSNPLNTHQSLDSLLNTNSPYLQAFYLHHFNGFLLNKVPIINKMKFETIAGVSVLMIDDLNYVHPEFFIGIEKKVKILNQYLKYGFYYTGRFNNVVEPYFKFKFGVDFLNTYTNKWNW